MTPGGPYQSFTSKMNDPASSPSNTEQFREQAFSARLEAMEARMDGRIASLQATINDLAERIEARFTQIDARFTQIDARFAQIDARFAQLDARMFNIEATVAAVRNSIGGLKTTMIVTAIGVVIGVATFNATVLSNMLASFESGRNQSEAQAKLFRQSEETAALLKQIQRELVVPAKK